MGRIAETFARLKADGRTALMPYLMVGYPERASALELAPALAAAGADLFEMGVPFSDPLADGATVQRASERALANGIRLPDCLQTVARLRQQGLETPLVLMGYFNPFLRYGLARFAADAAAAGVDGLIVVDLPPEHNEDLCHPAQAAGLDFIRLTTPTTDDQRLPTVLNGSSGFVYYVSVAGVTGAGAATLDHVEEAVARLRRHTDLPVSIGFGIRTPEHAASIARLADGVVVGSALVDKIANAESSADAVQSVLDLCRELAEGVRNAR